jgi:hypothetical protein
MVDNFPDYYTVEQETNHYTRQKSITSQLKNSITKYSILFTTFILLSVDELLLSFVCYQVCDIILFIIYLLSYLL